MIDFEPVKLSSFVESGDDGEAAVVPEELLDGRDGGDSVEYVSLWGLKGEGMLVPNMWLTMLRGQPERAGLEVRGLAYSVVGASAARG